MGGDETFVEESRFFSRGQQVLMCALCTLKERAVRHVRLLTKISKNGEGYSDRSPEPHYK